MITTIDEQTGDVREFPSLKKACSELGLPLASVRVKKSKQGFPFEYKGVSFDSDDVEESIGEQLAKVSEKKVETNEQGYPCPPIYGVKKGVEPVLLFNRRGTGIYTNYFNDNGVWIERSESGDLTPECLDSMVSLNKKK